MTVIAVAGGLGDLGRTIVGEIMQEKDYEVFVLSRKSKNGIAPKVAKQGFPTILYIDYTDQSNIRNVLRDNLVDTVISTLNLHWDGAPEAQLNLIRASAESGTVKRFIPSEFNIDYHSSAEKMPYPPRIHFLEAEEELRRHPQLKFSLVRNGYFMDYLGLPFGETSLHPLYCLLDLKEGKAVLPGDGSQSVVFTHTRDLAKYINKLIKLPGHQWPEESAIIGQRVTLQELVRLAEAVTGRAFKTSYDNVAELAQGKTTELPSNRPCYAYFPKGKEELDNIISTMMIGMASGVFDISGTSLNTRFPDINPISLEEFLKDSWCKATSNGVA